MFLAEGAILCCCERLRFRSLPFFKHLSLSCFLLSVPIVLCCNMAMSRREVPVVDVSQLCYSEKYFDDKYEYRHVIVPKEFAKHIPRTHLMTETEWRNFGIQQSPGWEHYLIHGPEPHVLMFRRPRTDLPGVSSSAESCSEAQAVC